MQYTLYDFAGNLGVALIIGFYLLLQMGRISSTSLWFSLGNALGALLVIISLIDRFNLSSFIIEAFWVLISLIGIIRYFRNTKS